MEGRPLDETRLIERARSGDVGAYEQLVRSYQDVAFRTAYLVTRDAQEAEDAAQSGFIKAYRSLGRFRAGSSFRPWLLKIVANEARNGTRSAGRRAALALRFSAGHRPDDAAPSPEAAALGEERRAELVDALNALRAEDRLVLGYRFLLGLSEAETAAALGCPAGTVKSRTARALTKLRRELGQDDD